MAGMLLRAQIRRATTIITVSEPTRQEILEVSPPGTRIIVATNAASALNTKCLDATPHDFPEGSILTVGSLEPRKNLMNLVDGFSRLSKRTRREHPLVILGAPNKSVFARAGLLSRLPEEVVIPGRVCDACLRRAYERAKVFVSVSIAEGFGIPVLESLKYGSCSLVLSDIPVYRWVVGPYAQYVDPADSREISGALLSALGESVQDVPAEYTERFSWTRSAKIIADELHNLST
ncbi:MAG: glycosyltransferase [Actinomycetota bacterium]